MRTAPFLTAIFRHLLVLLVTVTGASAATFTVTNTNDSGAGSLRQAILAAIATTTANTIVFDPAVFSSPKTITVATEIRLSNGTPLNTLTITGPGAHLLTVSGNNVSRIFATDPQDTISISGMTLTKGAGPDGGAIQNEANLTLTDMVFLENKTNSGGAIYTANGTVNILRCTFTNNETTGGNINGDGGSAMEIRGGTVNITDCTMSGGKSLGGGGAIRTHFPTTITNTIIENNTSGGAGNNNGGGAIFSSGELTLTNCIVRGNTAGGDTDGGGIRNEGKLTLVRTVVINNFSTGHGGGILDGGTNAGDFVMIIDSTISNNVANSINNFSGRFGGGIRGETTTDVTIIGSTVSGNKSQGVEGDGGGIWTDGAIKIDRCTISGNTAGRDFGGARLPHNFSDPVITNSTITNNSAGRRGGGLGRNDCGSNLACRDTSLGNTIVHGNGGGDLQSGNAIGTPDAGDGGFVSLGHNLVGALTPPTTVYVASSTDLSGVNPNLSPLQNNGGFTETHALQAGSPAIDKGKRLSTLTTDQRGVARPTDDPAIPNAQGGDGSDIGAYEIGASNGVAEKTLGNIATRLPVLTGERVLIGGIIVAGQAPKRVMIRAIGPTLGAFGVAGTLNDPTLELFQGNTLLASNDNWRDSQEQEISATGLAPSDNREAAIVRTLNPGNYTAIVRGKGDTTGVALVEGYDLEQRPDSKLANISTRGFVGGGDDVLIGGFIAGPSTRVVVRATGPSLGAVGIQGALQDPTLQLVNSNGEALFANDNWKGTQRQELEATGLQPSDDREAAIVATLTAGKYTAVVKGAAGNTGVGLVEVYNLQ